MLKIRTLLLVLILTISVEARIKIPIPIYEEETFLPINQIKITDSEYGISYLGYKITKSYLFST